MAGDQHITGFAAIEAAGENIPQGIEVAQRLRHLAAIHDQVSAMHPVTHERLSAGGLTLGNLVLMVREDVIHPAGMKVKAFAQVFRRHGRTFDMPSRPPPAPGRIPYHVPVLGIPCLPQGEIRDILLLILVMLDSRAGP